MTANLWRHRDFLRLWAAQAISAFGSRITRTALPIIAVEVLHQPDTIVGVLVAAQLAPGFLLALFAGGFVDRGRKRRILIAADVVRAVAVATIAAAWLFDVLTMVQVIAVGAVVGAASALFQITDVAMLPSLIGKDQLGEGNAKLEVTESIAEIGGPSSAGVLIGAIGAPLAVAFDAASYLWSAIMLAAIRTPDVRGDSSAKAHWREDLRVGFRAIFDDARVRPMMLSYAVWSIAGGFFMALYTPFCLRTLDLSTTTFGVIIALGGVGSLGGAIVSGWLVKRVGLGATMIVTASISLASEILIPLATGDDARSLGFLAAHQILGDGFSVAFVIQAVTLRQTVLPRHLLGRVNAASHVMAGSMLSLGALLAGLVSTATDTRTAIWVGAVIGLIAPVLLWPLARLKTMPAPEIAPK